jgi:hypothetical protein
MGRWEKYNNRFHIVLADGDDITIKPKLGHISKILASKGDTAEILGIFKELVLSNYGSETSEEEVEYMIIRNTNTILEQMLIEFGFITKEQLEKNKSEQIDSLKKKIEG